jgi:hypothetical protein
MVSRCFASELVPFSQNDGHWDCSSNNQRSQACPMRQNTRSNPRLSVARFHVLRNLQTFLFNEN